jgi:hypothetical protein
MTYQDGSRRIGLEGAAPPREAVLGDPDTGGVA